MIVQTVALLSFLSTTTGAPLNKIGEYNNERKCTKDARKVQLDTGNFEFRHEYCSHFLGTSVAVPTTVRIVT